MEKADQGFGDQTRMTAAQRFADAILASAFPTFAREHTIAFSLGVGHPCETRRSNRSRSKRKWRSEFNSSLRPKRVRLDLLTWQQGSKN